MLARLEGTVFLQNVVRGAGHVYGQVEVALAQFALSALSRPYSVLPVGQLIHKLTDANSDGLAEDDKKRDKGVLVSCHQGVLVVAVDPGPAVAPGVPPRPIVESHHSTNRGLLRQVPEPQSCQA